MRTAAAIALLLRAAAAGSTSAACDARSCVAAGTDHVLLQVSHAGKRDTRVVATHKASKDEEECRTSEPGEQCYAAAFWAKEYGVKLHPEWYPGLDAASSFEEFQAQLEGGAEECPRPCNLCHTAAEGEECHDAVSWAMHHGIRLHPGWYIGLTSGSSFEEFQAYLHSAGHSGCPAPCNLCRVVMQEGEPCYTDLKWAMEHGIEEHPEWYPGLSKNSSNAEVQNYLHTKSVCPKPCGQCHTAEAGERCHAGVTWAMNSGIQIHPEWYPELTASSSFEEFQLHLHQGRYESCPEPCM